MTNQDYWVEYFKDGQRLGAGFLLTSSYALTALHCLRKAQDDNDELDIVLAAGERVCGRVHRRSQGADLALIHIPVHRHINVPYLDRATSGEAWRSPYRPSKSHIYLDGKITEASTIYHCVAGEDIEALQLECNQSVGDYSGYSGGPVERKCSDGSGAVVALLLEQYPDQQQGSGELERSSNVLFAASLAEAFRRFDCFNTLYLLNALNQSSKETADRTSAEVAERPAEAGAKEARGDTAGTACRAGGTSKEATRATLEALRDFKDRGLVSEQEAARLSKRVISKFIRDQLGDGA
jgi:hypothetical protein